MRIKWTPYRGELEPVTHVTAAEIVFYKDHMEVLLGYDFISLGDGQVKKPDHIRASTMISKSGLSICRSIYTHLYDMNDPNEEMNMIEIYHNGQQTNIYSSNDDQDKIYTAIKKWMMAE